MGTALKQASFQIPEDLLTQLRETVGKGELSRFVSEALKRELQRLRQLTAIDETCGAGKGGEHPDHGPYQALSPAGDREKRSQRFIGDEKMNKAIKAALLSALVFPGAGQFYLKRYWRGLLMMMTVVLGFALIIVRATIVALDALKIMQNDGTAIDMNAISHLTETSSINIFTGNTTILVFLAACWVFSVVDAYFIGKRSING